MSARYEALFARLARERAGAFVPFAVLGDPDGPRSRGVLEALVAGGADALELGIPFSDPVADGPTIQAADQRALAAGATPAGCLDIVRDLRAAHPDLPVGLLVYANLVVAAGVDAFYQRAAAAGVDSVLIADVPTLEAEPFVAAARRHGVAPVLVAPPNATPERLATIAGWCEGYTYVVARAGVTGARDALELTAQGLPAALEAAGAPPSLIGFGISTPDHVRAALRTGAAGAISGSAVVRIVERHAGSPPDALAAELTAFVAAMKAATGGRGAP